MYTDPAFLAAATMMVLILVFMILQQQLKVRNRRKGDNERDCDDKGSDMPRDVVVGREDADVTCDDSDVQCDDADTDNDMGSTTLDIHDTTTALTDAVVTNPGSESTTFRHRSYSDVTSLAPHASRQIDTWFDHRYCQSLTNLLSSSCPALNTPVMGLAMKHLDDEGHPKSMENLLQENSEDIRPQAHLETDEQNGFDEVDGARSTDPQMFNEDETGDEDCNPRARTGTVDSSEDFLLASEASSQDSEDTDDSFYKRRNWARDDRGLTDVIFPSSPREDNNSAYTRHTSDLDYLKTSTRSLISRSGSLTGLLEVEESEDEPALFSKKQRLEELHLGPQDQMPPQGGDDHASYASLEDSVHSCSGSEVPSRGPSRQPYQSYNNRTSSGLPESTSDPGCRPIPDPVLSDDEIVLHPNAPQAHASPAQSATGVAPEHTFQKAKRRNNRKHSSLGGADAKLHKSAAKNGVSRKSSFLEVLLGQQRQNQASHRETKSTDQHCLVAFTLVGDAGCDVCHQPLAEDSAVRCENCLINVHDSTCLERLPPCDRSPHLTSRNIEGPSPWSHDYLDPNSLSASGLSPWGDETMREYKSATTAGVRQTTQKPVRPYSERNPSTIGMTKPTAEPYESIDGVIPWLNEEPDLQLTADELGDHIYTVDAANVKKLTRKDVERQSTIRELINTERHYVNRLKIIQKIFAHTMITKLKYSENQVSKLFPRIDELVEIHEKFLHQLLSRQATHEDRFVDEIGDILLDQFQGTAADKMVSVYGVFSCKHKEAMQLYKEFLKNDRNFQIFAKYCHSLPACEKREIPDFILGVTVRLAKYWILIDSILKFTIGCCSQCQHCLDVRDLLASLPSVVCQCFLNDRQSYHLIKNSTQAGLLPNCLQLCFESDKKERKLLGQASLASKAVLHQVDQKMKSYEKLIDIQSKMDSKAITFKNKKFKRHDLNVNNRELLHVGKIGWMSAQGRVAEILAVVLTDIVVFLQQNEQKYTFFLQDNKSCVIPLHNLLVREKGDVKASLGIYMINQNPAEMYELVCRSKKEREEWIRILQHAIRACRKDVESKPSQTISRDIVLSKPVDINRKLEVANKVNRIIEQLHQKDEIIRECCDDKNKLMLELLQLSTENTEAGSRPNSQEIESLSESVEIVFAAMQEASRLTGILQNTESNLNRSISVCEHDSNAHLTAAIPRRAETFSGFDSSHGSSKILRRNQTITNVDTEIEETPTYTSSDKEETDRRYSDTPDTIFESKYEHDNHSWEIQVNLDTSSEQGSMDELSAANVLSLIPAAPTHDQMASVLQLVQYLNSLMNVTSRQCTMVESLRAELAGAKEEISRLSADVHSRYSSLYRHDQLEELRQLQGNLTLEKHEWEKTKLYDYSHLQTERENLETERKQIEKEKMNLRKNLEALKMERDLMLNENRMKEQGFQVSQTLNDSFNEDESENVDSSRPTFEQRPRGHRRSASENKYDAVTVGGSDTYSPYAWVTTNEFPYRPLESVGSPENFASSSVSQDSFPFYFMGTNHEERTTDANLQSIQLTTDTTSFQKPQSVAASSSLSYVPNHSFSPESSAGLSRGQSLTAVSRIAFRQKKNSQTGSSDSSWKSRFSQPKGKR